MVAELCLIGATQDQELGETGKGRERHQCHLKIHIPSNQALYHIFVYFGWVFNSWPGLIAEENLEEGRTLPYCRFHERGGWRLPHFSPNEIMSTLVHVLEGVAGSV